MKNCTAVTAEEVFRADRRTVLKALGLAGAYALLPAASFAAPPGAPLTAEKSFTTYNNFYEFGFGKSDPSRRAGAFTGKELILRVDGEVEQSGEFTAEELIRLFGMEERVYAMRCVEAWSMIVPWNGFELGKLLRHARPRPSARFVVFESAALPDRMPAVRAKSFPFPYIEALRLDEAMHPLTLLATGAYGKPLLPQNGAPVRLVAPWKYGFKYAKSLVRISLVAERPLTTWERRASDEYGFYANVNPRVPHPRWPQDTETLFGPGGLRDTVQRPTLLFNGYGEVAPLYAGLDLSVEY